ncbi:3-oxoadipate enol-lactonase [Pseudonocardia sulfidoxydans NBRC 16205]|uniref:3-oxoadipate enol-lactonase n=1 Tax=Pseudonocardia sulfidoxydans NBRC 16205 TaxID=1223511 RepID=A0A511DNA5_9PSEU|nr:alpha/beta fold hydrolase [Pseudonocardia sulfidoxydans]GEL26290.1 3-oxoadipate enol-lactonase [Pseudonocardia sulfidoxydans NBRC 16205]
MTATGRIVLAHERHDGGGGGAAPVVLMHSLGADGRMWDAVVERLRPGRDLVVPDSRGHGRSPGGLTVSVEGWVEDLDALLAELAIDTVSLVGVSLGGIQAVAFAAAHPGRVRSLVVADSFVELAPDVAATKIAQLAGQADTLPMAEVADRYVADTFADPVPPGAETVRRAIAAMTPGDYAAAVRACFGVRITHLLPRVAAPTLVLWGDRDAKTPRALSETIRDGIAGARLAVVPDAGHLSNIDNPGAFARLAAEFLDESVTGKGEHRHG